MEQVIKYFGQAAKIGCDEKCNKAWGINNRPREIFSGDEDDYAYLSDEELDEAPLDPGTSEGGQRKPINKIGIPNKWCIRECERCMMSMPEEYDKELILKDFSERVFNIPSKHV